MAKKKKEVEVPDIEERPDELVLPDEFNFKLPISGIELKIKPWSWGKYTQIAPRIDDMFEIIESSNVNVSNLAEMFKIQDQVQPKLLSGKELTDEEKDKYNEIVGSANHVMMKLMAKIGHLVVDIIESSSDLSKEEIEDLNPTDVYTIVMSIYYINPTVLGNVFQPFAELDSGGQ